MEELVVVSPATVTAAELLAMLPDSRLPVRRHSLSAATAPVAEALLMVPSTGRPGCRRDSAPVTVAACKLTLLSVAPTLVYPKSPT